VYRVTYVIARFLALNGVASIEVRASHFPQLLSAFIRPGPVTRHQHSRQPAHPAATPRRRC
jgi:hypothetical protein